MRSAEALARKRARCAKYYADHREAISLAKREQYRLRKAAGTLPPSLQPEYKRAYHKRRYASEPAFRAKMTATAESWAKQNPDKIKQHQHRWGSRVMDGVTNSKRRKLRQQYGLTVEEYLARVAAVGGRCQACGKERPLNVDHAHDDGHVRGMICGPCNRGIGLLGDSLPGIEGALRYLQVHL